MDMIPGNDSTLQPSDGGTPSPPNEYESDTAAAVLQDILVYSALAVSCILGIPGNLMVLVRLSCRLRHSNLTRRLFFSLAVADLLFLLGLPVAVAMRSHVLVLTDELCQLQAYFSFYFLASGFSIVVLMSIQRYFKVLHPQKWSVLGQRGEQMLVLAPWFVGFVSALPVAFLVKLEEGLEAHCSSHFDTSVFLQVVYTSVRALGYLVLLVFYVQLIRGVKRAVLFNTSRMFKLIVLIVVTALVCSIPGIVVHVLTVFATWAGSRHTLEVLHELEVVEYLYFFNSSLHPFFYAFASGRRKGGWGNNERTETTQPTM